MTVRCPECRYDLAGLTADASLVRCPECGHEGIPYTPPTRRQIWKTIGNTLAAATLPWSAPIALDFLFIYSDSARSSFHRTMLPTTWLTLVGVITLMVLVARRSPARGHPGVIATQALAALLQLPAFAFFLLLIEVIRGIDC